MYAYSPSYEGTNTKADFRSDTVTRPTAAMMAAIAAAEVGDDVYGEDPTTNALEARAAELLGKEAGLFLTSGTQSNLAGLLAHCGRGEEVLTGAGYHIAAWEAGGASVLGSVLISTLERAADGRLDPALIKSAIKPDDYHMPETKLLSIENPFSGVAFPLEYMDLMAATAHDNGLKLHCDGARLMNAATALGVDPKRLVAGCDSVSLCLSKGLGTPAGTVLVGDASLIERARRIRKMLGGGMRQTGLLAAAGLHALDQHIDRMAEDHRRARMIAEKFDQMEGISVDLNTVQTNVIFAMLDEHIRLDGMGEFMAERGIVIIPEREMRLITHLDHDDDDCHRLVDAMGEWIRTCAG